jgi:long-chain acyl-CoA synthetase
MSTTTREDIDRAVEGRTVAREFLANVRANGSAEALRWATGEDSWSTMTFDELADAAARAAAGFRELGVQPGDRVVIMMRNIPEFHWVDLGVLLVGATPVSIYNSRTWPDTPRVSSRSSRTRRSSTGSSRSGTSSRRCGRS